jgi:predicted ATP-grasp superfamily ATP-dependent carboligase
MRLTYPMSGKHRKIASRSRQSHPPAIVLGLESAIGLTIIRELGEKDVPVIGVGQSSQAMAAASRYCLKALPRPNGPIGSWLPTLASEQGAAAIFAVSENDLLELAALPPRVGDCLILAPRQPQLDIILNKSKTLEAAARIGLKVPETWHPIAGVDQSHLLDNRSYPLIAKWDNPTAIRPLLEGAGLEWRKSEIINDKAELLPLLARFERIGRWPLIQQFCPGVGFGQMLHMASGRATLRFQHIRLHEWPPEGGVSTLCKSEDPRKHTAQMDLSERLLSQLEWDGPAMVEYRYNAATGTYWLMEVNGRFWGSMPLARHCGATFAWETYRRRILGQADDLQPAHRSRRARYMIPETKRLAQIVLASGKIDHMAFNVSRLKEILSFAGEFLRPNSRYYVFCMSDPGPFFRDGLNMCLKILRRIVRL